MNIVLGGYGKGGQRRLKLYSFTGPKEQQGELGGE